MIIAIITRLIRRDSSTQTPTTTRVNMDYLEQAVRLIMKKEAVRDKDEPHKMSEREVAEYCKIRENVCLEAADIVVAHSANLSVATQLRKAKQGQYWYNKDGIYLDMERCMDEQIQQRFKSVVPDYRFPYAFHSNLDLEAHWTKSDDDRLTYKFVIEMKRLCPHGRSFGGWRPVIADIPEFRI